MDEIKKLADKIRKNPENYLGKNIIIGLGDNEKADVMFMAGDPSVLAQMLGAFIDDLRKGAEKCTTNLN